MATIYIATNSRCARAAKAAAELQEHFQEHSRDETIVMFNDKTMIGTPFPPKPRDSYLVLIDWTGGSDLEGIVIAYLAGEGANIFFLGNARFAPSISVARGCALHLVKRIRVLIRTIENSLNRTHPREAPQAP